MSDETRKIMLAAEDMKTLLSYTVSEEDTKKYQDTYDKETASNSCDPHTKFQYAWCLAHSKHFSDIKKGGSMFEEIFKEASEEIKRDSLFYLALTETKLKNYCTANKYVKAFLSVEPTNVQAQQLDEYIQNQLQKDGIKGMALFGAMSIFGGATAVVLGTLAIGAAVGFALTKKKRKVTEFKVHVYFEEEHFVKCLTFLIFLREKGQRFINYKQLSAIEKEDICFSSCV